MNTLCNIGSSFIELMADLFGMSFNTLSVILFMILGPLSTICFYISTRLSYKNKKTTSMMFYHFGLTAVGIIIVMFILTLLYLMNNFNTLSAGADWDQ
ncbi:MAG: hypothetical protein LUC88_08870 [Prevotella sp.]|nr:hypothetical protein [Prevotella sp.]